MRRFVDSGGRPWDVVVGRESWGTLYALFVPAARGDRTPERQALLGATGYDAAQLELAELDDAAIADLFRRSEPRLRTND